LIEQQTILSYQRILRGSSPSLCVLLQMKQGFVSSVLVKYNILSIVCSKHVVKARILESFLIRVENYGYVDNYLGVTVYLIFCLYFTESFNVCVLYIRLLFSFIHMCFVWIYCLMYCILYVLAALWHNKWWWW